MKLHLVRTAITDNAVLGKLYIDNVYYCYTLERLDVMIPLGEYGVEMTFSPKFGRMLPLLDNVPGREAIRIHPGNKPEDSDGCILVGAIQEGTTIGESRKTSDDLNGKITGDVTIMVSSV